MEYCVACHSMIGECGCPEECEVCGDALSPKHSWYECRTCTKIVCDEHRTSVGIYDYCTQCGLEVSPQPLVHESVTLCRCNTYVAKLQVSSCAECHMAQCAACQWPTKDADLACCSAVCAVKFNARMASDFLRLKLTLPSHWPMRPLAESMEITR